MEINSLHKYIALNKMANGTVEVIFAGQPCLTVNEGLMGSIWKINPVFAKLVYGANIFEDIPQCDTGFDSTEEAVAAGLVKLHELGAFNTEVDFPEDTYAATMKIVEEEVTNYAISNSKNLVEAAIVKSDIMRSIKDNTFPLTESMSEYTANLSLAGKKWKKQFHLKTASGSVISSHDTESEAIKKFKTLDQTKGVKIIPEETVPETKEIDDKYDKWESDVRAAHPGKALKFKGRIEKGINTTSAEVTGQDRSYGVWDHDKNEGHVLGEETETEKKEESEIVSAIKKDKKFISKKNDGESVKGEDKE